MSYTIGDICFGIIFWAVVILAGRYILYLLSKILPNFVWDIVALLLYPIKWIVYLIIAFVVVAIPTLIVIEIIRLFSPELAKTILWPLFGIFAVIIGYLLYNNRWFFDLFDIAPKI